MKKFILKLFLLLGLGFLFYIGESFAVNVINTGYTTNCIENQSVTYNYYLTSNNSYRQKPWDGFTAIGTDAILYNSGTKVGIWRHDVITQCNTWLRSSNAAKQGISNVIAIYNDDYCYFNIPPYTKNNSTSIDAQIQYTIAYRNTPGVPSAGTTTNRFYYRTGGSTKWICYPGGEKKDDRQDCPQHTINVGESKTHVGECINYRVFWCGDGLINGYNGSKHYSGGAYTYYEEECDPNAPGWNNQTCNPTTCKVIQQESPECNTAYSGQTHYTNLDPTRWLTQNTPNLCTIGTLVQGSFNSTWSTGNSRHFYWSCNNGTTIQCEAKQRWCGDGKVSNGEDCDFNDPYHAGWNGNGYTCNNQCQLVPPQIQAPQCSSTYNNQTQYTPNGNNWLNQNMNLCTIGSVTNFQFSWNPGHSRHFTWNCNNDGQSTGCLAYQQWCGDGKVETNHGEACDPADPTHAGWNNNGYTCNAQCQLVIDPNHLPQCNSAFNGTHYVNNPAYPNWLTESMNLCSEGTVVPGSLNHRWNGYGHVGHYSWTCSNGGTGVSCQANQQRCGDGIKNGNETCDPNDSTHAGWNGMQCNSSCQLYNPGHPILTIDKEQISTGDMTAGSTVAYKITVRNIGSGAATGVSIYDVLPKELQYLTSSISIVPNSTYQFTMGTVQIGGYSRAYIRYFNITLNANGTATVYLTGKVKNGFTFDTLTNCATVSGSNISPNEDCVTTTPPTPHVPHLIINKELLTAGDMTAGSTVAYKVTLTNDGNATYYNAYIDDVRPNALNYLTSSIAGISNYDFTTFTDNLGAFHIKYYNFNLAAGQSAIVYLTGTLKQGFNFNQTTNCAMTSGAVDCEDFPLTPVPYIQKYQQIGNINNPNGNGWTTHTLNVELRQFISYRIDFGNSGNKAATGEVRDILPHCVQYVSGWLVGAIGVGPQYYPNTHTVRFRNIPLAPGQRAHMMVIGKIKQEDGCQNVYSYLNTGEFHFINTPWQNSTVLAVRPDTTDVEITKEVSPTGTVKQGDVVTYTITYKNKGPEILQSYTIIDYWPDDKLQFSGVVYPTTPTPIRVSESIVKRVFNTPLAVDEQKQIIIQGIVK